MLKTTDGCLRRLTKPFVSWSLFGICISEVYHVGINYFNEAVKHGSFEYEISKDTIDQAEYANQVRTRDAE